MRPRRRQRAGGERYVQRTQTVGAVLRSVVTIVVSTLAVLTIMATLGVPLAPLSGLGRRRWGGARFWGAEPGARLPLGDLHDRRGPIRRLGDTIDTGEVIGTVEDVSLRVTRLRDHQRGHLVRPQRRDPPGGQPLAGVKSIAAIAVPFALDADIAKVTQVLTAALEGLPDRDDRVIEDPSVVIESMSAGTITVRVSARCVPTVNLDVQRDLRVQVKEALDAARSPWLPQWCAIGVADDGDRVNE